MKRLICCGAVLMVLGLAGAAPAAEAPYPRLDDAAPGLAMNFDDGTSALQGWGMKTHWSDGDWDFADGKVTSDTDTTYARLVTTLKDDPETVTAMSTAEDWVFSMEWVNNVSTTTTIFELVGFSGDVAKFQGTGGDNFRIMGGDGGGGYVEFGSRPLSTGVPRRLTVHYQADNGLLDFYVDDDLVATDFASRGGGYDAYFLQLLGGAHSPAGETFDTVLIGLTGGTAPQPPACSPGDADDDGDVDDDDLSLLLANWGEDTDCAHGEFSGVPPVNDDDLSLLLANWTGSPAAAVPEPVTAVILVLGVCALRRRRN